jgi:trimeric autotransporter adhesin
MIKYFNFRNLCVLILLFTTHLSFSQNVLVSGALVGNGTYSTLSNAFIAIGTGAQTGSNISIQINGNVIETNTASLFSNSWASLTIQPSGTSSISGSIAGPLINFNSVSNIIIDGLNTAGNSLTLENSNNTDAAPVLFLDNNTSNITVNNTTLLSANSTNTSGTVSMVGGTATGNDNISFNNCTLGASTNGFPVNAVYAINTTTINDSVSFNNCNIENFFSASLASAGIIASTGNNSWTIDSCRFYQTSTRTYTSANTHRVIQILSGNNHNITNNIIGHAAASTAGIYTMAGNVATRFIAIDLAVGTVIPSSVQGNLINYITLATNSGASTLNGALCGINVTAGNVNIGTTLANSVGSTSSINLINVNSATSGATIVGIHISSLGIVNIQNNIIAGFSSSGNTGSIAGNIIGINVTAGVSQLNISKNIIGNNLANNMRGGTLGLTTGSSNVSGISLISNSIGTAIIDSNVIRNLASYGTGNTGFARGIQTSASTSSTSNLTITNNNIYNLISNSSSSSIANGLSSVLGIATSMGTNNLVSKNTIHDLYNTNTGNGAFVVGGITHGNAINTTIASNTIYNLGNASVASSTQPPIAAGIIIRSGTTAINIYNNMISLGTADNNNTTFIGIYANHGSAPDPTDKIYHNTINIDGTVAAGAQPSFGFVRTDFTATARTASIDFKNNIITNSRNGGTGSHYAIANHYGTVATNAGWPAQASNNNILNANASTIGYWNGSLTFNDWKLASACDLNSFNGVPVTYVNAANDLHLNMGTAPTIIESNAQLIPSITTDIDGQSRPGPSGSVNNGGFAPDLGADEIDANFLDILAPVITYTPLAFTCVTGDRIVTATITDLSGVPTSGALQPRIYFNKNGGLWYSTQGTLSSGTATNGSWTFTIDATLMGGLTLLDSIRYYIAAQDILQNIGANPFIGFNATNVNTIINAPSTPNVYRISSTLNGTYNIGVGGAYTTLTDAAIAYNNSCLSGPITFALTDATYSSETFPILFTNNTDANVINTLTIKPAASVNALISGSSTEAIIMIKGGDYITIDGSNSNTVNSICPRVQANRNLIIENINNSTSSGVISINTSTSGKAATHNKIINTVAIGNGPNTTGVGINISGPTIGAGAGANFNNYNKIINDSINKVQVGVFCGGLSTNIGVGNIVNLNVMTSTGNDAIGRFGIMALYNDSIKVLANTIRNIVSNTSADVGAISMGSNALSNSLTVSAPTTNAVVMYNDIDNIIQTTTFSAGGVIIAGNAGNSIVANNSINRVFANGTSGDFAAGIYYGGGTGSLKIYNNTVNVTGSLTGASQPNMALGINGNAPNVDIKNNILVCTGSNGFDGNTGIGLSYTSTVGNYANLQSNHNAIFVSGTNSSLARVGSLPPGGTALATLANWQAQTGQDTNSVNIAPTFVSASDAHLVVGSNTGISRAGISLPEITTDIDCQVRSNKPDIGSDEICDEAIVTTFTSTNDTICAGDSVTITITAATLNDAQYWQWTKDSCNGAVIDTGLTIKVNPTTTTTYFAKGAGGCTTGNSCQSITITVNPLPNVIASATSLSVCIGNADTLQASGANTYTWNGTATATSDSILNNISATAIYTVIGTDTNGCVNSSTVQISVNMLPNVFATALDSIVCANDSVTLYGAGANTYVWNNGVTNNKAFTQQIGNTFYEVIGTDANGCSNSSTVEIIVNALPTITAAATSTIICAGNSDTLQASGATNYTWNNIATITSDTILTNINATATYTVIGTDANGCSNSSTVEIIVNALPTITASATSTIICTGNSDTLQASGATNYTWNNIATITSDTILTNINATATYTVIGTDANGCTNSSTVEIIVNALPTITAAATSTIICAGNLDTLQASGAINYTWNNITTATSDTILTNINATATYTVIGTDANGCSNSSTVEIIVNALPTITAAATSTIICAGNSDTLQASGAITYTWNNIATSSSDTIINNISTTATYTVIGTDANGCSNSSTVEIIVNALPTITASATSTIICAGNSDTLQASGATNYKWNNIATITSDTILININATATYTVIGTDANGCSNSSTVEIIVNALPIVTASATSAGTVCSGSSDTLKAIGASNYTWNNITTSTSDTILRNINATATYTVIGTDANACSSSSTVQVIANALATDLAQTIAGNIASTTGSSTKIETQLDGDIQIYTDANCNLIASVQDSLNGSSLGTVAAMVQVDASVQTFNNQPYLRRHYDITPRNQGVATVVLYYTQNDFDDYNTYATANAWPLLPTGPTDITGIANFRITQIHGLGILGGTDSVDVITANLIWNAAEAYWSATFIVDSFSTFYAHAANVNNAPLDINLLSFTGFKNNDADVLNWVTNKEVNNDYFTLQHSTNTKEFTTIASIASQAINGNSNQLLNYKFVYHYPQVGHNYYRLQQTSLNGTRLTEAKIIDIFRDAEGNVINVYPNPASADININYTSVNTKNITVYLYDVTGKKIISRVVSVLKGSNTINIDLQNIAVGTYQLQVLDSRSSNMFKVVKQ